MPRMELLSSALDLFLHIDVHLNEVIGRYGAFTYVLLFLIIFCETGLVVTPFLPGDSLLFAAGTFAAAGSLEAGTLFALLSVAAVLGDTLNYWIGHRMGPKVFSRESSRLLNRDHLERARVFYERYGAQTIILARFAPILRTFAPFVAGIGRMSYRRFLVFNIVGGILWIGVCVYAGFFFGNLPFVKRNFSAVVLAIVVISFLPAVLQYLRRRRESSAA